LDTKLILIRPSNTRAMEALLNSLSFLQPNYPEVGTSIEGSFPSGFRIHHYEIELSASEAVFNRAVAGLQSWQAHRIPRISIYPQSPPVRLGESLILEIGPRAIAMAAPCRIVRVVEDSNKYGFAYGTLPGHPECGEESFVVSRLSTGKVVFEISGFSQPGSSIVRLAGPIARTIQTSATNSYLRALKRFAEN
jgi:uncharacterized protein (UPF0548 family)